MEDNSAGPTTLSDLLELITASYDELSPQFRQIAHYVKSNPDEVALAPIRVLAGHIGVHPSTIVRFAKLLNYSGFKEMQLIFKFAVYAASGGENSRILAVRQLLGRQSDNAAWNYSSSLIAREINSLYTLMEILDYSRVEQLVTIVNQARTIWIINEFTSQIAASHLADLLSQLGLDVRHMSYSDPLILKRLRLSKPDDVVIIFEFAYLAAGLDNLLEAVEKTGARITSVITEGFSKRRSLLSFVVPAPETDLTAALCAPLVFAHMIAALLAHQRDPLNHMPRDFGQFDPRGW